MSRRKASTPSPAAPKALLGDIRALIGAAHQRAASAVNAELTLLFWRIGQRIHTEVLAGQRAEYGEEILPSLAEQLVRDYGRSFADKNLRRMVQFAATYPQEPIVVTLSRHLSWSHFVALLPLKDPLQRDYYAQMASTEHRALERADATRAHRVNAVRTHSAVSEARGNHHAGAGGTARCAAHDAGAGHARPVHPRLPRVAG